MTKTVRAAADVVFARPGPDDRAHGPGSNNSVPGAAGAGVAASAAGNSGFAGGAAGG